MQEPSRSALGLLLEAGIEDGGTIVTLSEPERRLWAQMIRQGVNAPWTSSAGRLFDAVAALLDVRRRCTYEGQAAAALEHLIPFSRAWTPEGRRYTIPLSFPRPWVADWGPMVEAILEDQRKGVAIERIAVGFHHALAEMIVDVAKRVAWPKVVLSGGCFQNAVLTAWARQGLKEAGFSVYTHRQVPPNDGGIALGQIRIAGLT